MEKKMIRILALVLCLSMLFCLTACGGSANPGDNSQDTTTIATENSQDDTVSTSESGVSQDDPVISLAPGMFASHGNAGSATQSGNNTQGNYQWDEDESGIMRYVMIYNPKVYKESNGYPESLNTGSFASQIDTGMFRADGLEMPAESEYIQWNAKEHDIEIPQDELNLDGNRADVMLTPYSKGDIKGFYCYDKALNRTYQTFKCLYAGTYCNIWSYDSQFSSYAAEIYGKEFDQYIYPNLVNAFGTARFADNGGKVNLLFYPMMDGLLGCFTYADIYSSYEAPANVATAYGLNTDHAILNINSVYSMRSDLVELMCSTMAHEFQHLICATDSIYALNDESCSTWLNEAMSGYVEEMLYPGAKELSGHYSAFATSDRIRYGQSLYNFETDSEDIGVYGSVYLYSEYLASLVSQDATYRQFHDSWRSSYSMTICDAEGLYNIMPDIIAQQLFDMVEYSDNIVFANKEEEMMSKLTLSFYLSLLERGIGMPEEYGNVDPRNLIYDELWPANIEGGGRIIIAVKDGVYTIPADADSGLVYVGLDGNFQPVTPFVIG